MKGVCVYLRTNRKSGVEWSLTPLSADHWGLLSAQIVSQRLGLELAAKLHSGLRWEGKAPGLRVHEVQVRPAEGPRPVQPVI